MKYWSWQSWIRWFVPLPLLVRYSKRVFGNNHVWYQDDLVNLELRPRNSSYNGEAVRACVDMAERYDADIEGCDADELIRCGEGIECSFRLAHIIKYGKFPPAGDAWSVEFIEMMKELRRDLYEKF